MDVDVGISQRLEGFLSAIKNGKLDGDLCPSCFGTEYLALRDPEATTTKATKGIAWLKENCTLRGVVGTAPPLFTCSECKDAWLGRIDIGFDLDGELLCGILRDQEGDVSHLSVTSPRWLATVADAVGDWRPPAPIVVREIEDSITGRLLQSLEDFFSTAVKERFTGIGLNVRVLSRSHAGPIEAGLAPGIPASGADLGLWFGELPSSLASRIDALFRHGKFEEIPEQYGNGALMQAKKTRRGIERKQVRDLAAYGSLAAPDANLRGMGGKLILEYAADEPRFRVRGRALTTVLADQDKLWHGNEASLGRVTKELGEVHAIPMMEFLKRFLCFETGSCWLSLRSILAAGASCIVVVLEPNEGGGAGGGGPSSPGLKGLADKLQNRIDEQQRHERELRNMIRKLYKEKEDFESEMERLRRPGHGNARPPPEPPREMRGGA